MTTLRYNPHSDSNNPIVRKLINEGVLAHETNEDVYVEEFLDVASHGKVDADLESKDPKLSTIKGVCECLLEEPVGGDEFLISLLQVALDAYKAEIPSAKHALELQAIYWAKLKVIEAENKGY